MNSRRAIYSVAFAVLVLFSSSHLIVGIHRCGGDIQKVSLFSRAEGCAMEKTLPPPCHKHKAEPCCQDETINYGGQEFKSDITPITTDGVALIVEIVPSMVLLTEVIPAFVSRCQYANYDPPLRSSDLTVSLQNFLI